MPRNEPWLRPFILDALNEQKYPNLLWLDESVRLFKLTFSRFGGRGPWREDEKILQDYECLTKHSYEGYSKSRLSLTTAVKCSDSFKIVKDVKDGHIFQFRSDVGSVSDDIDSTLQAQISLTEDSTENHLWPRNSVLALIECYRAYQEVMEDPNSKKKDVWHSIAEMMRLKGEEVTADMCSSKWRNLRRTYKVIQVRNRLLSERGQHSWEYFDLLRETYGRDYNMELNSASTSMSPIVGIVEPILICSSPVGVGEVCMKDDDEKERNAVETIKRQLHVAHIKHCSEIKKLRECIYESNKLNSEKNEILKNSLKERNMIMKKFLRQKNDILKELLRTQKNAV